jgi:hypothetical protein
MQKCSFKECPFTWVATLNVFFPKEMFRVQEEEEGMCGFDEFKIHGN